MHNPFLIVRGVFFALSLYLNLVTLVSAAVNIGVTRSAKLSVPGASVFVILNSIALFFFVTVALAEIWQRRARTAQVMFECGWTLVLSVFQIAAAVDVTVNGPPSFCRSADVSVAVCATSTLLVPTCWLSSLTLLAYALMLLVCAVSHTSAYPAIWAETVYNVPWFTEPKPFYQAAGGRVEGPYPSNNLNVNSSMPSIYSRPSAQRSHFRPLTRVMSVPKALPTDLEKQAERRTQFYEYDGVEAPALLVTRPSQRDRAPWAERLHLRRGFDNPFARANPNVPLPVSVVVDAPSSAASSPGLHPPPPLPPKVKEREKKGRKETTAEYRARTRVYEGVGGGEWLGLFPEEVRDPNAPVVSGTRKDWIRATKGEGGGPNGSSESVYSWVTQGRR